MVVMLGPKERTYWTVISSSIIKGATPILSTIANFGTIQFVIAQYWEYMGKCCSP
jgi:hypothetical protein